MSPLQSNDDLGINVNDNSSQPQSSPPAGYSAAMAEQRPQRRSGVNVRVVEGETVILDRQGGLIHQLNPTASSIWDRCDGHSTLNDIAQQLTEAFDVDAATAREDVATTIAEFRRLNLLV